MKFLKPGRISKGCLYGVIIFCGLAIAYATAQVSSNLKTSPISAEDQVIRDVSDKVEGETDSEEASVSDEDESLYPMLGPECDEPEESSHPNRWQIDLAEFDGKMEGTIQFHRCPDGGYVVYVVRELARRGSELELYGEKVEGRGPIHYNPEVHETEIFILDEETQKIDPNFAELPFND